MDGILGWLGDFLGLNKGQATQNAATQNKGIIQDYGTAGNQIIDTGAGGAQDYLKQALGLTGLQNGSTLLPDALGINGGDGSTRALDAFQHSPGYSQAIDQGTQALMRTAAQRGDLGGGGLSIDLGKYVTGQANQDYNNWLDRITGNVNTATNSLDNLAGLSTGTANAKLGLAGDVAGGLTGSNNQYAAGKEANQGWGLNLLSNAAKIGGSFAGYGGF